MKTLKKHFLVLASIALIISLYRCNKDENLETSFIFSVQINDDFWGTDDLTSKISQGQFYIANEIFSFSKVCFDNVQGKYFDPEIGWVGIQNLCFEFSKIEESNNTYSAEFSGKCTISEVEKNLIGSINEANYFPESCKIEYTQSNSDTFSLLGRWNLVGYKEYNSIEYNYPPCLVKPGPYIEIKNNNDESKRFLGVFVRNSYGGDLIVSSPNTLQILSFSQTLVYYCWDFDREYEDTFFETLRKNEYLSFSINNNLLTIESSPNGKKYFFYKN